MLVSILRIPGDEMRFNLRRIALHWGRSGRPLATKDPAVPRADLWVELQTLNFPRGVHALCISNNPATELNQYSVLHPALRPDLGSLLSPFQGQRACTCSRRKKTRVLLKPVHAEKTPSV
ncbi:uncharacterized [Tachysurus ichikawai]